MDRRGTCPCLWVFYARGPAGASPRDEKSTRDATSRAVRSPGFARVALRAGVTAAGAGGIREGHSKRHSALSTHNLLLLEGVRGLLPEIWVIPGNLPPSSSARSRQLLLDRGSPWTGAHRARRARGRRSDATRSSSSAHATERPRFQETPSAPPGDQITGTDNSWHRFSQDGGAGPAPHPARGGLSFERETMDLTCSPAAARSCLPSGNDTGPSISLGTKRNDSEAFFLLMLSILEGFLSRLGKKRHSQLMNDTWAQRSDLTGPGFIKRPRRTHQSLWWLVLRGE